MTSAWNEELAAKRASFDAAVSAGTVTVTERGDADVVEMPLDADLEAGIWWVYVERGYVQYHREVDFREQRGTIYFWRLK